MRRGHDSTEGACQPTSARYSGLCALSVLMALAASAATLPADPLVGAWRLDLARTHYGPGADQRKQETFTCEARDSGVTCTVRSIRSNGRALVGRFAAAYDGRAYPVEGIPDVDEVSLRRVDAFVADATFSYRGKPVFGYRSVRSSNGRSLIVVSVDPVTRRVLNSVVVYENH